MDGDLLILLQLREVVDGQTEEFRELGIVERRENIAVSCVDMGLNRFRLGQSIALSNLQADEDE